MANHINLSEEHLSFSAYEFHSFKTLWAYVLIEHKLISDEVQQSTCLKKYAAGK